MLINLSTLSVLSEQTSQDTLSSHPHDGSGHTRISGTMSLTGTSVTTLSLCGSHFTDTETRVNSLGLSNNQTILEQLSDVGTYINVVVVEEGSVECV